MPLPEQIIRYKNVVDQCVMGTSLVTQWFQREMTPVGMTTKNGVEYERVWSEPDKPDQSYAVVQTSTQDPEWAVSRAWTQATLSVCHENKRREIPLAVKSHFGVQGFDFL